MVGDEPAPTLTTQFYGFGSGRFGHPTQDRAISLREGAILQGFPESYSFLPEGAKIHFKTMGRMIGNAVPVTLGEVIGRSIREHLDRVAPDGETRGRPPPRRSRPSGCRSPKRPSPEVSRRMSRVRQKGTKPELALRRALYARGLRYRVQVPS